MKLESELKLQAYLDGELSPRQARKTAAWIEADAQAKLLMAELNMAKTALAQGELEMKLAESPEFYWSKIERQIERGEQAEQVQSKPKFASLAALRRLLAPAAGVALVAFLTVYTFKVNDGVDDSTHPLAVVENLSEHTGAYSFRSQSEKMFVVWLYDRSDETLAEPDSADEQVDQ